ncbi:hypothetical protein TorRG33x02_143350 [Trema orientale]|uniref:Uncharacterized protein n=1 Tax=Trema orientale TaxID=63057 RepID=A0A2P5EW98_TREOI|nr:hypothetical protein TorRG33x02_143350 [Trema orientale]
MENLRYCYKIITESSCGPLSILQLYSRLVHTDILNLLPLMLHEDRAIATNLARKKAIPLQSAKKLAIKLNKEKDGKKEEKNTLELVDVGHKTFQFC